MGGPAGSLSSLLSHSILSHAEQEGYALPDDVHSLELVKDIVDILQENTDCMIEEGVALERAPGAGRRDAQNIARIAAKWCLAAGFKNEGAEDGA